MGRWGGGRATPPPQSPAARTSPTVQRPAQHTWVHHSHLLLRSSICPFLGPKLWEKPIQAKFNEDDFFVMNIDEFLAENNLQVNVFALWLYPIHSLAWGASSWGGGGGKGGDQSWAWGAQLCLTKHDELCFSAPCRRESHHQAFNHCLQRWVLHLISTSWPMTTLRHNETECSSANPRLSLQRVKASKAGEREGGEAEEAGSWDWVCTRGIFSSNQQFDWREKWQDLALATVPGADFDPSARAFDMEELRPQPIIRKRAKQFVASEKKDDKYWESRTKNTIAARRWERAIFCCWEIDIGMRTGHERRGDWRRTRLLWGQLSWRRRMWAWGKMLRRRMQLSLVKRWR